MRKIREVLRLRYEVGLSGRQVAASLQMARSTVGEYERRFTAAGPELAAARGAERYRAGAAACFRRHRRCRLTRGRCPTGQVVHEELRRPGVTLMLLWEEYRAAHPQGFAYSWFCEHYRAWAGKLDLVMRQTHRAGEKLFVDYAGQTSRGHRSAHRRGAHRADLRRGPRRVQLHLCRGDLDTDTARLDRCARPGLSLLRRGQRGRRPG